jgi:hypothetical protein
MNLLRIETKSIFVLLKNFSISFCKNIECIRGGVYNFRALRPEKKTKKKRARYSELKGDSNQ